MEEVHHDKKPHGSDVAVRLKISDSIYSEEFSNEYLWAKRVGDGNSARIRSIPFLTYGVNLNDVVAIDSNHNVTHLIEDGGHYTYRLAIQTLEHPQHRKTIDKVIKELITHGYEYEQMNVLIIAVDAPDEASAIKLENILISMQNDQLILEYDTSR